MFWNKEFALLKCSFDEPWCLVRWAHMPDGKMQPCCCAYPFSFQDFKPCCFKSICVLLHGHLMKSLSWHPCNLIQMTMDIYHACFRLWHYLPQLLFDIIQSCDNTICNCKNRPSRSNNTITRSAKNDLLLYWKKKLLLTWECRWHARFNWVVR